MKVQVPSRNTAATYATSKNQHHKTNTSLMARRWGIGLETDTKKIKVTTQKGERSALHALHHRYRTKQQKIRYNTLNFTMYYDKLFGSKKSSRGHIMSQIFVTDK